MWLVLCLFDDPVLTGIYTLSLHDALPILRGPLSAQANPAPATLPGRNDELERVLSELTRLTDCRALVVARRDGLVVIHRVPKDRDPAALAAIAASTVDFALSTTVALDQG